MSSQRISLFIIALVSMAALAQNAWYWGQLPERVATHFNLKGVPNGWMSKTNATIVMCGFQVGMPFLLIAITRLASQLPASMVNIPNREYWLHPDRRAASMAYVQSRLNWIALAFALFAMAINHLVFMANRDGKGLNTGWFGALMTVFLGSILCLVIALVLHFRLPRSTDETSATIHRHVDTID